MIETMTPRGRVLLYGADGLPINSLASTRPRLHDSEFVASLRRHGLFDMVDEVCRARGVYVADLGTRSRSRSVAHARAEVWFRMRTWPERAYSLPEIGAIFDRDHTTVGSGIKAHIRRMVEKGFDR